MPTRAAEAFACTLELEWPVDGLEPLSFLLARVLEPLCARLRDRGRRAAALELDLGLVDGRRHRRSLRPAAPSAQARTWRTLMLLDLEAHPPHEAIQVLTVRAEPTPARTVQFSLLDPAQPSPERLAETLARLHAWTATGRAGDVRGEVVDRAGPWRASGDWWDAGWSREEWDVSLGAGGLYRIFRDRLRDEWFVEGELD